MNRRWKQRGVAVCFALGLGVAAAQLERGTVITHFRVPQYDDDGKLKTQVFGDQATAVTDHVVDITNLRIETFEGDEVDMRIIASACRFDQRTGVATSDTDVRITRSNMVISGIGFRWESEPSRFEIHRDARVVLRGARRHGRLREEQKE